MAFQVNRRGMSQMLVMPGMVAAMGQRAEKVAALARQTAPVDENGPHPGRYRDSIHARTLIRPASEEPPRSRNKQARACGRVTASAPESLYIEFGTENTPAQRTLRNALRAAGG